SQDPSPRSGPCQLDIHPDCHLPTISFACQSWCRLWRSHARNLPKLNTNHQNRRGNRHEQWISYYLSESRASHSDKTSCSTDFFRSLLIFTSGRSPMTRTNGRVSMHSANRL